MRINQSRRHFLASMSAAGAAGVLGARTSLADAGPPETTTIRLGYDQNMCVAPQFIAEDLLRAEGFTDIRYVQPIKSSRFASDEIDFNLESASWFISHLEAGDPITALAGVHVGCFELFAHEPIRTISDLRGKGVGIQQLGSASHLLLSIMAAHVGLTRTPTLTGSRTPISTSRSCSPNGKWTLFFARRRSRRSCAPTRSAA